MAAGIVGPQRSIVLYNGINMSRWQHTMARNRGECRARLGIAPEALVVGSVGRLNWAKDYTSLVRGFREAFPDPASPDRLVIIGEGDERQPIERAAVEAGGDRAGGLPGG